MTRPSAGAWGPTASSTSVFIFATKDESATRGAPTLALRGVAVKMRFADKSLTFNRVDARPPACLFSFIFSFSMPRLSLHVTTRASCAEHKLLTAARLLSSSPVHIFGPTEVFSPHILPRPARGVEAAKFVHRWWWGPSMLDLG